MYDITVAVDNAFNFLVLASLCNSAGGNTVQYLTRARMWKIIYRVDAFSILIFFFKRNIVIDNGRGLKSGENYDTLVLCVSSSVYQYFHGLSTTALESFGLFSSVYLTSFKLVTGNCRETITHPLTVVFW